MIEDVMSGGLKPFNGMSEEEASLVNMARSMALSRLYDDGQIRPLTIMDGGEKGVIYPCLEPFDEEGKTRYANCVRALSLKHRATRLVYVSEAWSVRIQSPEEQEKFEAWRRENPDGSFGDYEGRVEIIVMVLESHQGNGHFAFEIKRAPDGSPYVAAEELEKPMQADYALKNASSDARVIETKGRFTHMLAPAEAWSNPVSDVIVAMAEALYGFESHSLDDEELREKARDALRREGEERRKSAN